MAHFILVHGSGQNARCWSRVIAALHAQGHSAEAPDLMSAGPEFGLRDYAAKVAESVWGTPPIVVAHSLCGVLLPLVPGFMECAGLVFLAAVIPEPGKSVRGQFTDDPSMFSPEWIAAGPRWFDKSEAEGLAREFLFHDCADEDSVRWALSTVEFLQTDTLRTQPCPLNAWPAVPIASIIATADRTLAPEWIRRNSARLPGAEVIDLEAGHCPHVSRPAEVAAILDAVADRALSNGRRAF